MSSGTAVNNPFNHGDPPAQRVSNYYSSPFMPVVSPLYRKKKPYKDVAHNILFECSTTETNPTLDIEGEGEGIFATVKLRGDVAYPSHIEGAQIFPARIRYASFPVASVDDLAACPWLDGYMKEQAKSEIARLQDRQFICCLKAAHAETKYKPVSIYRSAFLDLACPKAQTALDIALNRLADRELEGAAILASPTNARRISKLDFPGWVPLFYSSVEVSEDEIFVTTDREYLGEFTKFSESTKRVDQVELFKAGYVVDEVAGMTITNPAGIEIINVLSW